MNPNFVSEPMRNTLLALLLALKNLENPLSEDERKALADVGQQLKSDPNDWDFIEEDLMAIIEANDALSRLYQEAKAKLDAVDRPIPPDLLPTKAELETVLTLPTEGGRRVETPEGKSRDDEEKNEISDIVIAISRTPKPTEVVKKSGIMEKLKEFLN